MCPVILALLMTLLYDVIPFQYRNTQIRVFPEAPLPMNDFAARLSRGNLRLALVHDNSPLAADFKTWLDEYYPGVPASAADMANFTASMTARGVPAADAEQIWAALAVPKLSVRPAAALSRVGPPQ